LKEILKTIARRILQGGQKKTLKGIVEESQKGNLKEIAKESLEGIVKESQHVNLPKPHSKGNRQRNP